MNTPTPNERLAFIDAANGLMRQALTYLVKADAPKTARRLRLAISSGKGAIRNAASKAARAERDNLRDIEIAGEKRTKGCQHLTGYWINKAQRNFRCYECQCQFHIGDNLPANHPTKGIEVWEAEAAR